MNKNNTLDMDKEQQDKNWNNLEQLTKELLIEKYNFLSTQSSSVLEAFKYALENTYGSHNLNLTLTYEDVAKKLFGENNEKQYGIFNCPVFSDAHCDKISAINALICVAKYLNGDWKPDWENYGEKKWSLYLHSNSIIVEYTIDFNRSIVFFRTKELAQQAIQILGEETIRLVLSTDY